MTPLNANALLVRDADRLAPLLAAKRNQRVAVCIPARDEASTIAAVLQPVGELARSGLVDDVIVVDDASSDLTAEVARSHGVAVVPSSGGPGKGQALATAVAATDADILVFLDGDVTNFAGRFVTELLERILNDEGVELVKASYRRSCDGRPDEGGRVTELLARPLLRRFFPELADVSQPLAGESALRRRTLSRINLAAGYGVEIGLLIDIYRLFGRASIAEADLGERIHRNRPLHQLRPHADHIVAAVMDRVT